MNPDVFLYRLQYEPHNVKSADWEPDWEDAPLPYKLYRGAPAFPLDRQMPAALNAGIRSAKPDLATIGRLLYFTYGVAQLTESPVASVFAGDAPATMVQLRRYVPSGGGLYSCELYIYLKLDGLPDGVYHYDAAHHRLILLREGNFDDYAGRALGGRIRLDSCFGAVFISPVYWKNFFKYHNFAYRLHGLDAGFLTGQLLEVSKRLGLSALVCFQFLDLAVNRLLGLDAGEESVYAVVPLSAAPIVVRNGEESEYVTAPELCRELPEIRHEQYIRSRRVVASPVLAALNAASRIDSAAAFRQPAREANAGPHDAAPAIPLPHAARLGYDLAEVSRKRYSPETEFTLQRVEASALAAILRETAVSYPYRNDLDGTEWRFEPRVFLYGCFYGVEGIPDGAYRYDSAIHALRCVRPGDHRMRLQSGMSLHNLNLLQVPLCFHVAGERNGLRMRLGLRGYRVQQMEAGMLGQRLLLAATAAGMAGRPLLGYDAKRIDALYGMEAAGATGLVQIPVGPCRRSARLTGSLIR